MFYEFFSPAAVLWLVIATTVLFVAAPHLELASKPAARTLRLGSLALIVAQAAPFILVMTRQDPAWAVVLQALLAVAFWGSIALAAWQLVQGAAKKTGLL